MAWEPTLRKATIVALVLFVVLSLLLTYPLALHLPDAVEDRQDALLNVWITAWDGRQLLNDPLHLFDANIFHPYPRTLAYSELLLGNALLALPISAATGNPVLGYNVALFLSFVLSGFGAYLLTLRLTRSPAAGLAAGAIFAFSSYRMTNLAQAQLLTTQWMPFALLSLYLLLRTPRPRHLVTFVLFFWLQALSSFYYAILLALTVLAFLAFELIAWFWRRSKHRASDAERPIPAAPRRSSILYLLLAAGCLVLLILPFALPYFQVQQELGFERTLADNEPFSASLRQYLMVPPRSVVLGSLLPSDDTPIAGGYPVDALFPGLVALALALWGLVRGQGRTRWFFALLLLAAFVLSLGPRLYLAPGQPASLDLSLPYAWLYAIVPGFKALRAPGRFSVLAMLSLSVLAGFGLEALLRAKWLAGESKRARRIGLLLASCLVLAVVLESLVWPAANAEPVPVGDQVPPAYRWLAEQPASALLELPMAFTPGGPRLDCQYLSTYHWHTTPDGYSGFVPPKHGQIVYEMERFPSERSTSLLQALDVDYVLVHTDRYSTERWSEMDAALVQSGDLTLAEAFGPDQVYRLQSRTFDPGNLEIGGYLPARAVSDQPYTVYLIALNRGARSHATQPTDLIHATASWEMVGGQAGTSQESRIQADLPLVISPDGGAAVIPLPLAAPAIPGAYRLAIHEQDGPLGSWQVEAVVEVGEGQDDAFPAPAQLLAWTVPEKGRANEPVAVDLTWRALGKIDAYYSVYVKLLDDQGNAIASWDGQPQDGDAPTLLWVPGATIEDRVSLLVPAGTPAGEYTVEAGMYRADDLARVLTLDADGIPLERVVLGALQIEP